MPSLIKLRRDTASNWTSTNPVLSNGEPGYDTTNNKIKIGNGTSTWTQLNYLTDATGNPDLTGYATEEWVQDQNYITISDVPIEVPEGVRLVDAPLSSKGSLGDLEGDVAFSNDYIYRCTADYEQIQTELTSIVATGSNFSYLTFYSPEIPPADMTGLTISGPSGYAGTVTGASIDQGAGQWQVPVSPDVSQVNGVYVFGSQPDIWKRIGFDNGTW